MRFGLIISLLTASLGVSAGAGAPPLTIQVSPGVSLAPANVMVRARVARDADNRALEIEVDSEDFFRSSMVTLDGDSAPSVTQVAFKGLPGGEYQVSVALLGSRGIRETLNKTIMVIASPAER
jgi:hypothetical protein